jgi:hypothetical protein
MYDINFKLDLRYIPTPTPTPLVGQDFLFIEASRSYSDTLGRAPLDERPARRSDLQLTTHDNHKRETSMSPARLEHAIPVTYLRQTHALDRAAKVTSLKCIYHPVKTNIFKSNMQIYK